MLSVGGGTLPHTLQEARSGRIEAQSTENRACLGPKLVTTWSKGPFHFPGSSEFPGPWISVLVAFIMGEEVGALSYKFGNCLERGSDFPKVI